MVERLFLAVLQGCLQFVIVVFTDHTHLLFLAAVPSKAVLLTCCLLLLPLWDSVIVLCFVVRYDMSILVLQSP